MNLPPIIKQLDAALEGWPDYLLTLGLIAGSIIVLIVAVKGDSTLKAAVLAWIVAP